MQDPLISIFWAFSGISLYAGISHLLVGLRRPYNHVHLIFSGLCFTMVFFTISNAGVFQSANVSDYVTDLRWNLAIVCFFFLWMLWFLAEYTLVRVAPLFVTFNVVFVVLLVANLLLPNTIQYQEIQSIYRLRLPGVGEFTRAIGINGGWFKFGALTVLAFYGFALYSLVVAYRRTHHSPFLTMTWAMVTLMLASIEGILVRMGVIRFIELGPLAFPGIVLVMSIVLVKERKFTEKALIRSELKHRMLFEHANDAILLMQGERIVDCNDKTLAMFNCARADIVGSTPLAFSPAQQADGQDSSVKALDKIQAAYQGHPQVFEWRHTRLGGQPFDVEVSLNGFEMEGEWYLLALVRDITDRKIAEAQVKFLAYHDALTGLPNRQWAKEHFELSVSFADRARSKMGVLFMDLDNFKSINDTLGHSIGDALLKASAKRLSFCMRDIDTLCRQGGDEFLILLPQVLDPADITHTVEKLLQQFTAPFEIDGQSLLTSLSIGLAVYPDDGKDFDTLLKKADTAMYQAKEAGRNTYRFFTEQMNANALEQLHLRNGLRQALDRGEFVLHYQPQIDLAMDAVVGAEALIRWHHPELGVVPPGRFIPVAEESGSIVQIGDWVLLEACRQAVAWQQVGLPKLVVAVNVSMVQFKHHNLENSITQALLTSGLDPACLELELTESILIRETEEILALVQRIKSLGVKLAIDDFGTGYSSLSYLKRFNVDKLKIDQSFIRNMADDPNDAAIVRAIIQMASSLNLRTIAEGVEDERSLNHLRIQHCNEAQGYHFAKPMPPDEFAQFVRKRAGG